MSEGTEVTIVCCWTNEKQYQDFVNSLKIQTIPYELIGIDNRNNGVFTSCAAAYNSVINQVKTKYVIYSHQDIVLQDTECLAKFVSHLEHIGHDDILGVAGVKFDTVGIFANFKHFQKQTGRFMYVGRNRITGDIMECDTVDECFFGGNTQHFRDYQFDEVTCDNWHLYAVDACLTTKAQVHGRVFICDINLVHLSTGNINYCFVMGFCRLARKYSQDFPFIRTTCIHSKTDRFHLLLFIIRRGMVSLLKMIGLYSLAKRLRDRLRDIIHSRSV